MPFPFRDKSLQFQALRAMGCANNGGADPNEIIELCGRIRQGNLQDWYVEWREAGERAFKFGEESKKLQDLVSARQAFLRAANYLRTAEFFRRDNPAIDKEALATSDKAREAFCRAMSVSPQYKFVRFEIPFEDDIKLPVYLVTPSGSQEPRPTIVVTGGFDGTKEELYLTFGDAALARGYNFVSYEGPGQGEVIRHQSAPFRPDWNVVLTAVTDALIAREEIDAERLILLGQSFGAWLAAKALTKEHRYAAAIFNDGVYDFAAGWRARVPWFVWSLLERKYTSLVSTLVALGTRLDIARSWGFKNALWTLGVPDGAAMLSTITQYSLTEESVQQIDTPMLILDAENDQLLGGQPKELVKHLGPHQRFRHFRFEKRYGGGEHCEKGASGEQDRVIFNWLAETFPRPSPTKTSGDNMSLGD